MEYFLKVCREGAVDVDMLILTTAFYDALFEVGVPQFAIPIILQHKLRSHREKLRKKRLKSVKRMLWRMRRGH